MARRGGTGRRPRSRPRARGEARLLGRSCCDPRSALRGLDGRDATRDGLAVHVHVSRGEFAFALPSPARFRAYAIAGLHAPRPQHGRRGFLFLRFRHVLTPINLKTYFSNTIYFASSVKTAL